MASYPVSFQEANVFHTDAGKDCKHLKNGTKTTNTIICSQIMRSFSAAPSPCRALRRWSDNFVSRMTIHLMGLVTIAQAPANSSITDSDSLVDLVGPGSYLWCLAVLTGGDSALAWWLRAHGNAASFPPRPFRFSNMKDFFLQLKLHIV